MTVAELTSILASFDQQLQVFVPGFDEHDWELITEPRLGTVFEKPKKEFNAYEGTHEEYGGCDPLPEGASCPYFAVLIG